MLIMLKYGYVAKWKKRVTVGFALLSIIGAFVAPIFVDEPLGKPLAFFTFFVCAFAAIKVSTSPDMMEEVRPVPDEFYKPLGAFNATVRGVAPHVVEVETDSGAILFADTDRAPEVAHFRGARVEVDASVVVSPAGQGDVRADGVGGFVDARNCKCTADYGADVAMGDEPRSKWNGKARFYAVTSVRAAD
jgi:hypothetical protein